MMALVARHKSGQNVRVRRSSTAPQPSKRKEANERRNQRLPPPPEVEPAPKRLAVVGPADPILLGAVTALIAFGVVMVYSASAVWAHHTLGNDRALLIKQAVHAALGGAAMFTLMSIDYQKLRPLTYPALFATLLLMIATVLGLGHEAGGASRWIKLGPVRVQPAEFAKLAVICWLAYSLSKKTARIRSFSVGFLPHVVGAGVFVWLCLRQPDFGSAVMIGLITVLMLFTAGAHLGYLLGAGLLALPLLYGLVASSEYRLRRIMSFIARDDNYQLREAWMSFGAGGTTGVGLGDSRLKLLFLPEAHTDFISAIIGEELGLIGFSATVLLFLLIVWRGIQIAFKAADTYGTYLAVGISLFIGTQAFTNLAVAVGLFPTKGLVLPFISYGGSSLIVNCCCVGILLNVSKPRSETALHVTERVSALPRAIGGVT
jgi:cell division protein FtsW